MEKGDLILSMDGINQSFFGVQVLFDAGIQLRAGEIHALVGENGAGKTTLIKILCGMYPEYTGNVTVDGQQVTMRDPRQAHDLGVFSVQQHRDLVPTMTAVENMFLGNYMLNKSGSIDIKKMRKKAQELFRLFETTIDTDVPVSELKISEQEIIAICKAISSNGKIFLIDEASAPLDNRERGILYGILRKLCDEGKGVIYISHHLEEVFTIGDRVTVLRNGRNVWTKNTSETDALDIISAMTGDKKLYERVPRPAISDEDRRVPVFEFESVSGRDLDGVSLKILKSEIVGFAGLDGSGTKEIAEMMFGLSKPRSGSIDHSGMPAHFKHPIKAIRSNIAMIPTERKVQGLVP
jgi:ribose transport system ATP-binding protein